MKPVCQIGSQLDTARPPLQSLDEIDRRAAHYLELDPERAGAGLLKLARKNVALARKAIAAGNAEGTAYAIVAALQAAWKAEMIEGGSMIKAGVTAYRKAESANARRAAAAEQEHDRWRQQAAEIRRAWKYQRPLTKKQIAEQINPKRWNTVRRYI